MGELERMLSGMAYNPNDSELYAMYLECHRKIYRFNNLDPGDSCGRDKLLREILGKCGANARIEAPFHCDYGFNIEVGDNFFANYNVVILDVARVIIGDNVLFAPNVGIYTAAHPLHPEVRNLGEEWGDEIRIGNNVWLGGNVIVNPGVSIGDNVVVGSGSVVVRDLPDNVLALGTPARIVREITEKDRERHVRTRKASQFRGSMDSMN